MIHTLTQLANPPTLGLGVRSLMRRAVCAVRAFRDRRARTCDGGGKERRDFLIKQDLAQLDRNQLRDIGLDRDAL